MKTRKTVDKQTHENMTDELRGFLAQHPDHGTPPEKVSKKKMEAWLVELDAHRQTAAQAAYLVGRALRAQRAEVEHGDVKAWEEKQATRLKRSTRSLRLYMQVAKSIDDTTATPLPISVLDRSLRDVPRAIQNLKAGHDPDYEPEKDLAEFTSKRTRNGEDGKGGGGDRSHNSRTNNIIKDFKL